MLHSYHDAYTGPTSCQYLSKRVVKTIMLNIPLIVEFEKALLKCTYNLSIVSIGKLILQVLSKLLAKCICSYFCYFVDLKYV
jgi:hypothetical protein